MIKLGDEVKDRITGFKGIVVCVSDYLSGCRRISLQSKKLNKEGNPLKWHTFDEPELVMVKAKSIKIKKAEKRNYGSRTHNPQNIYDKE